MNYHRMPMFASMIAALGLMSLTATPSCARQTPEDAPDGPGIEEAFLFAFPLYEFARTAQTRLSAENANPVTFNEIRQRSVLSDHTARGVTAPNNDTIYASAFLDLQAGPVELNVPSNQERYFSIAFMSAVTDNFAYIGTRATGGQGGRFWVAGPGWAGSAPDDVTLIEAPTNDVWMLMRTLVDGPQDLDVARAFQSQLTLSVVAEPYVPNLYENRATDVLDPENFLAVVNEVLRRSPGATGPIARAPEFAAWGLGADTDALADEVIAAWRDYLPVGMGELREAFLFPQLTRQGWTYQPPGVGDFGTNDRLRAVVALGGLAALGEEEAMYFHANFDPQGERLNGSRSYRWRIPAGGVPVDGFWSLTLYEAMPDGRYYLVENPIQRYSIGDRTEGLIVAEDGAIDILIQADPPAGDATANWLPAPREGHMRLALRAYLPREELQERSWLVPPLELIE